jgi:hypothetical protein
MRVVITDRTFVIQVAGESCELFHLDTELDPESARRIGKTFHRFAELEEGIAKLKDGIFAEPKPRRTRKRKSADTPEKPQEAPRQAQQAPPDKLPEEDETDFLDPSEWRVDPSTGEVF